MIKTIGLALLTCAAIGSGAHTQQFSAARAAFAPTSATAPRLDAHRVENVEKLPSNAEMLSEGVIYGVVGALAGAVAGVAIMDCPKEEPYAGWSRNGEWCGPPAGLVEGATVGATLLIPAGVHAASGRTSYIAQLGVSVVLAAAAWATSPVTPGVSLMLMPIAQAFSAIRMEHWAVARGH